MKLSLAVLFGAFQKICSSETSLHLQHVYPLSFRSSLELKVPLSSSSIRFVEKGDFQIMGLCMLKMLELLKSSHGSDDIRQ